MWTQGGYRSFGSGLTGTDWAVTPDSSRVLRGNQWDSCTQLCIHFLDIDIRRFVAAFYQRWVTTGKDHTKLSYNWLGFRQLISRHPLRSLNHTLPVVMARHIPVQLCCSLSRLRLLLSCLSLVCDIMNDMHGIISYLDLQRESLLNYWRWMMGLVGLKSQIHKGGRA